MTEEQRWEAINKAEDAQALQLAIYYIAGEFATIRSNRQDKFWPAENQALAVVPVINGTVSYNLLTRAYGIRQQALYIKASEERERRMDELHEKATESYVVNNSNLPGGDLHGI